MNQPPIIHSLTLRFRDPADEAAFRASYYPSIRRQSRVALVLTIVLYLAYGFLDPWLAPRDIWAITGVRLIVVSLVAAVLALTYRRFDRWREWILGMVILIAAAGIMAMLVIDQDQIRNLYYAGLILVILGGHALYRVRFPAIAVIGFAIIVAYNVEALLIGIPGRILVNNNFALVTAHILGMFASYNIEKYARRSYVDRLVIEQERARSENLLLNILPPVIAERLKADEGTIADRHDEASVLFADICDFSALSSRLSAEDLVRLLNGVFSEFDEIAREHGIEKIKTVGDAYMVVAGLPLPQPDHLERIADAALAMRERVGKRRADPAEPLEMRMGIATGSVVAGVIGRTKFSYDLWGDTVNMASRMETHGVPGRIQVTEPVYARLKERYALEPRGDVEVKGKGRTRTYWLLGKRTSDGIDSADQMARSGGMVRAASAGQAAGRPGA